MMQQKEEFELATDRFVLCPDVGILTGQSSPCFVGFQVQHSEDIFGHVLL